MKNKGSVPLRMCVLCREMMPKGNMFRLVEGERGIELDLTGKKNGRGCYICGGEKCMATLEKPKAVSKAFKGKLSMENAAEIIRVVKERKSIDGR